ncbi:MAG: Hsp20/alpha crystallin family protein [Bulleidia sp.]|nr:Hsp20/alpha crystallin family protein [Erysipelotrichaceae bacterium]MDY2781005.1 Hsp20/alpha crystallin family protein [Bulleidia sp.]
MVYEPMRRNGMFSDMFDDMFTAPTSYGVMSTDIHKKDGDYILDIELPGYKKEDIKIALEKGTLSISAHKSETQEEKDAKGNLIRQERYTGETSRSFYVGDGIKDSDVKASYKDGILTISVPSEEKKQVEEKKFIGIE